MMRICLCLLMAHGVAAWHPMTHGADANHPCDNDCRLFCCKWGEEEQCLTDCGCPQHTCAQAATPAKPVKQMPECDGGQGIVKYFQLNQDVSKCMDIAGGQVAMGAGVQISTCNGQDSQKFIWCSDGRIVSRINDNMCLDIPGGDPSKTSYLQMYPCNGAAGQYWGYDYNAMAISPTQGWQFDNMCMDVDASSGKLVNYWCSPGGSWQAQKWQVNDAVAETSNQIAFPRAPTADAPVALAKLMTHGTDANHPCDNDCRLFCCKWGEEEQCLTDCGCPQHTCPQTATPAKPVKQMPECDGGQ